MSNQVHLRTCDDCDGEGIVHGYIPGSDKDADPVTCPQCRGTGRVLVLGNGTVTYADPLEVEAMRADGTLIDETGDPAPESKPPASYLAAGESALGDALAELCKTFPAAKVAPGNSAFKVGYRTAWCDAYRYEKGGTA